MPKVLACRYFIEEGSSTGLALPSGAQKATHLQLSKLHEVASSVGTATLLHLPRVSLAIFASNGLKIWQDISTNSTEDSWIEEVKIYYLYTGVQWLYTSRFCCEGKSNSHFYLCKTFHLLIMNYCVLCIQRFFSDFRRYTFSSLCK